MKLKHTYDGFKAVALERLQDIERMINKTYIENPSEEDIENMRRVLNALDEAKKDLFVNIALPNQEVTRI